MKIFSQIGMKIIAKVTAVITSIRNNDYLPSWGLGDQIRGALALSEECHKMKIPFEVIFRGDELRKIFPTVDANERNSYTIRFINFENKLHLKNFLKDNLSNDNLYVCTNGYGRWPNKVTKSSILLFKQLLSINENISKRLHEILSKNTDYDLFLIRTGDDALRYKKSIKFNFNLILNKKASTKNRILIGDSDLVKECLNKTQGFAMSETRPVHFAAAKTQTELEDIFFDLFLCFNAKIIYYYSNYEWVSGFVMVANKIFGVPIKPLCRAPIKIILKSIICTAYTKYFYDGKIKIIYFYQRLFDNLFKYLFYFSAITNSKKQIAIVTAANTNYFYKLMRLLETIGKFEPHAKIYVFDLGLSDNEINQVKSNYNSVIVEKFNYSKYPNHFDVKVNAGEYAWKPIVIQKILSVHDRVIWMDAGNILTSELFFIRGIIEKNLIYTTISAGRIIDWAHHEMIYRLGLDESEVFRRNLNAACIGLKKSEKAMSMVDDWVSCAIEKNCIAPQGSGRLNHRQDQAAFTILAYKYNFFKSTIFRETGFKIHQ